jgi:hypothetical protein
MDKRRALEESIAENAKRLTEIAPGDEISQRVKKRISADFTLMRDHAYYLLCRRMSSSHLSLS